MLHYDAWLNDVLQFQINFKNEFLLAIIFEHFRPDLEHCLVYKFSRATEYDLIIYMLLEQLYRRSNYCAHCMCQQSGQLTASTLFISRIVLTLSM